MVFLIFRLIIGFIDVIYELFIHIFFNRIFFKNVYSPEDQFKDYVRRVYILGIIGLVILACSIALFYFSPDKSSRSMTDALGLFLLYAVADEFLLFKADIKFSDIRKKMNYADKDLYWEGSRYSRKTSVNEIAIVLIASNGMSLSFFVEAAYQFFLLLGVFGK